MYFQGSATLHTTGLLTLVRRLPSSTISRAQKMFLEPAAFSLVFFYAIRLYGTPGIPSYAWGYLLSFDLPFLRKPLRPTGSYTRPRCKHGRIHVPSPKDTHFSHTLSRSRMASRIQHKGARTHHIMEYQNRRKRHQSRFSTLPTGCFAQRSYRKLDWKPGHWLLILFGPWKPSMKKTTGESVVSVSVSRWRIMPMDRTHQPHHIHHHVVQYV